MIKKQKYSFDFITGVCMPEIDFTFETFEVQGEFRPINVTWTPELAQDLEAYHNIDAEAELTALLTQQLTNEIDQEIINNLHNMVDDLGEMAPQDPIQPQQNGIRTPDEIRQETVERWSRLGLLDGLQGHTRENITQLYEGQAATLINEEPTQPNDTFETIQFPMVRRVYTRLLANDIVTPIGEVRHNEFNHRLTPNWGDHNYVNNLRGEIENSVNWRTDDTWTYENLYGSLIGISMDMKPLKMVKVKKEHLGLFDVIEDQSNYRR